MLMILFDITLFIYGFYKYKKTGNFNFIFDWLKVFYRFMARLFDFVKQMFKNNDF